MNVDVYTTEEQQVEAIKKWWKKNGTSTVAGVLIGLSAVIGWRLWLDQQSTDAEIASAKYDAVMSAQGQGMSDLAMEQGSGIIDQHAGTPYAALTALLSAKVKLEKGDTQGARNHYNWIITQSNDAELKQVARIRLARIMLNDGEHQQALNLLGQADAGAYLSSVEEIKGDIYLAMNQPGKARTAYEAAISAPGVDSANERVLRMKLDDLGGSAAGKSDIELIK